MNIKAAWLAYRDGEAIQTQVASSSYEIWRDKEHLPFMLRSVYGEVTTGQGNHERKY
jgi:hypothetical protein